MITNGCIEARLSTKQIKDFYIQNNYKIVDKIEDAQKVIFWGCGLRDEKRKDTLKILKELQKKKKKDSDLVVCGCITQVEPELIEPHYQGKMFGPKDLDALEKEGIDHPIKTIPCSGSKSDFNFVKTYEKEKYHRDLITRILERYVLGFFKRFFIIRKKFDNGYYIRVSTGCTGACSYCTEKLIWGYVKSRPMEDILAEFKEGIEKGHKNFVLQAGDLGAYGKDTGGSLVTLLDRIISDNKGKDFQIDLSQIEPNGLITEYAGLKKIFETGKIAKIGCPVQSGSDRILELMNRGYRSNEWRETIIKINKKFPGIDISTHLMIGFPGETEKDFKETMSLFKPPIVLKDCGFFIYSSSPKVRSSKFKGQVPNDLKNKRYIRLRRRCILQYIRNYRK